LNEIWVGIITATSVLLGAAVGGFATYKTAGRASKDLQVAEQLKWARERREDAYRGFIAARNRYVETQVAQGTAMQFWTLSHPTSKERDAEPFDWDRYIHDVADALLDVERNAANVELFGSKAANAAVQEWLPNLRTNYGMATRPGGAFGAGIHTVREDEIRKYRDPFIALVRRELAVPD
jgi:hypothetical protein